MSYGHGDLPRVVPLVSFLRRICGLQIWFDRIDGSAAKRSSELLAGAIGSRAGRSSACLRPGSSRPGARMSLKYPYRSGGRKTASRARGGRRCRRGLISAAAGGDSVEKHSTRAFSFALECAHPCSLRTRPYLQRCSCSLFDSGCRRKRKSRPQ